LKKRGRQPPGFGKDWRPRHQPGGESRKKSRRGTPERNEQFGGGKEEEEVNWDYTLRGHLDPKDQIAEKTEKKRNWGKKSAFSI